MNPFRSGVSVLRAPYIGGVTEFFVFHLGNARRLDDLDDIEELVALRSIAVHLKLVACGTASLSGHERSN
jgi:hypothetical protein